MALKSIRNHIRHSRHGLNIFYYGKGKGKTTAAIGLAVRAAGAGMDVYVLQFVKSPRPKKGRQLESGEWPVSSEILYLEQAEALAAKRAQTAASNKIGKITTIQVGAGFVGILGDKKSRVVHIQEAKKGYVLAKRAIKSDKYDVVILDELLSALEIGLLKQSEVAALIKGKPKYLHLVYTGHDANQEIIELSDLVSDITMVKHPYYKGLLAQRGIDF